MGPTRTSAFLLSDQVRVFHWDQVNSYSWLFPVNREMILPTGDLCPAVIGENLAMYQGVENELATGGDVVRIPSFVGLIPSKNQVHGAFWLGKPGLKDGQGDFI